VTVESGRPKLVIACYAQGQTQRSFLSVWRTVTVFTVYFVIVLLEAAWSVCIVCFVSPI